MISILAISALSASAAMAQTTTTETTTVSGTSTTAVEAPANSWGVEFSSESYSMVDDQKNLGFEGAPINANNAIGLVYKGVPTWEFELDQYFDFLSNRENGSGSVGRLHEENAWEIDSVRLRLGKKTQFRLGSSDPLKWNLKYYLPNNRLDQKENRLGLFRADASMNWTLSPNWSVTMFTQFRALLNKPESERGSDAEYYRIRLYPVTTYALNDTWAFYYLPMFDGKSTQAQRGDWTFDDGNYTTHEIGMTYTTGAWTINPAIDTDANNANGEGSLLTSDSRVYAHENSYYCLNIYASY